MEQAGTSGTTARLGMNRSGELNVQRWQKQQSRLVCADLDGGLVVCMCGSLLQLCLPEARFCIQHEQPVEGLHEGDNMGGSGEVEDEACCGVLDEL